MSFDRDIYVFENTVKHFLSILWFFEDLYK